MSYKIAGIDVHKRMLAVVVSEVEVHGEYAFERRQFGTSPAQLQALAAWLLEQQVEEVVMESTAQYWKPVWGALERYWQPGCRKREGARPTSGRCIWRRRSRTAGGADARTILPMPNGWSSGWWRTNCALSFVPGPRTAFVADGDAHQVPVAVQSGAAPQPFGGVAGRGADQALQLGLRSAGRAAGGACCRPWRRGRPTRPRWWPWPIVACVPRRSNCATPWEPAETSIPSTVKLVKTALEEWQRIETQIRQLEEEMATLLGSHQDQVATVGGGPGPGSRFGTTDHGRSGSPGRHVSFRRGPGILGRAPAPARTRAPESTPAVAAPPKATVICGAFLIRPPMPPSNSKAASSPFSTVVMSPAWATTKPSASSPIAFVACSGRFCTKVSVTRNAAPPSAKSPHKAERRE